MAVLALAFTDAQIKQITTTAAQIPRALRRRYLQRVSELLNGRDFGDGDVHRAARAAAGEIMHGPRPALADRPAVNRKESRA
jgi:hypothetical protein